MTIKIAWFGKHFGEEPIISGTKGSGTIFFSGCNLHCQFCQNYQISQEWIGTDYSISQLADIMLDLQKQGSHNINLVSPTIWITQIREAIVLAKQNGLIIPIVYNTNAYDNLEELKTLKGLIDIYLPDFKYSSDSLAEEYSKVKNYKEVASNCILEMIAQQPNNIINDGIMERGVIIRHLILPNHVENTKNALDIINSFSKNVILSLMTQYNPLYKAKDILKLNRPINIDEYNDVMNYLNKFDFEEAFYQPFEENAKDTFVPDFNKENPFI
jgi:putative pyruvate formate lyase activating enzyme